MEAENANLESGVDHADSAAVIEEEVEELKQELVALIADKQYHEFIDDIVKNKNVAEDANDKDYDPSEEGGVANSSVHGSGERGDDDNAVDVEENCENQEDAGSSSGSSDEDDDAAGDAADEECGSGEVKIPMEMLTEAEKRFPPFWRTKQALRNLETGSYKSEDDLDYVPEDDENASQEDGNASQEDSAGPQEVNCMAMGDAPEPGDYRNAEDEDTDGEAEEEEVEDEVEMKEVEDLKKDQQGPVQPDVNDLAEMVEMMTLPPEESEPKEINGSETESMEEEDVDKRAENILTFDHDGYVSAEDPDFVPEDKEEDGDSSASSDDESSDEVDRME